MSVINLISTMTSFDDVKNEILKVDENGAQIYKLAIKDNDDLFMIYYTQNVGLDTLEFSCKSVVFDKVSLKPIVSQYNKILYNDDALKFLDDKPWSNVVVQKCYEGTFVIVFWHAGKWYVTTRRCLDANESTWIKGNSYYSLFMDAIGNMNFDNLNKEYCYHFVLVHPKNKNIVCYDIACGKVYHVLTT